MAEDPTIELNPAAEPCGGCGYPLAADQRYCLNCGRRRGEPRVDYAPYLASGPVGTEASPVAAAAPMAVPAAREPSPLIAVAGIALLGLMLLVGVLIGQGGGSGGTAPAPAVVQVDPGAVAADTAAATGGSTEKVASTDEKTKSAGDGGGGGGGGGGTSGAEGSISNPEVASRQALEDLQNSSGADYSEASQNLPDTIALPGKPPPTDNEDPGAGTSAVVVK